MNWKIGVIITLGIIAYFIFILLLNIPILLKIILAVIGYFVYFFLIPLLILTNFLNKKSFRITEKIKKIAIRFKDKNKEKTLRNIFNYVEKQYSSEILNILFFIHRHFYIDVDKIIDKKMYLGCHIQTLVLKTLLIATKQFSKKDIKDKLVMSYFGTLHKFALIKIENKIFKADPFYNILGELKNYKLKNKKYF